MGNVAIIIGMLLCMAGGYLFGEWQTLRIAAVQQSQLRERAEMLSTALVAAERRVTAAEASRAQTRDRGRSLVAASSLRDCPLPDDVASLLAATATATRADAGSGQAGAAAMPRQSNAAMSGSR